MGLLLLWPQPDSCLDELRLQRIIRLTLELLKCAMLVQLAVFLIFPDVLVTFKSLSVRGLDYDYV